MSKSVSLTVSDTVPERSINLVAIGTHLTDWFTSSLPIHDISKGNRLIGTCLNAYTGVGIVVAEVRVFTLGEALFEILIGSISAVEVEGNSTGEDTGLSQGVSISPSTHVNAFPNHTVTVWVPTCLVACLNACVSRTNICPVSRRTDQDAAFGGGVTKVRSIATVYAPVSDRVGVRTVRAGELASEAIVALELAIRTEFVGIDAVSRSVVGKGFQISIIELVTTEIQV